jgi:methionine salvage enolase-phosphatase E1
MAKTIINEDTLLKTDLRTLWSETLIELLHDAVREDWTDKAIKNIISELYNKGYKTEQLMVMLDKKIGPDAATKLARFVI